MTAPLPEEKVAALAEALAEAPLSWDFFPDPDGAVETVLGLIAPLVAGWLAEERERIAQAIAALPLDDGGWPIGEYDMRCAAAAIAGGDA